MQEVCVAHSLLTILCPNSTEDFKHLLRRGEESNLVFVRTADLISSTDCFTLAQILLLLLTDVKGEEGRSDQEHRVVVSS